MHPCKLGRTTWWTWCPLQMHTRYCKPFLTMGAAVTSKNQVSTSAELWFIFEMLWNLSQVVPPLHIQIFQPSVLFLWFFFYIFLQIIRIETTSSWLYAGFWVQQYKVGSVARRGTCRPSDKMENSGCIPLCWSKGACIYAQHPLPSMYRLCQCLRLHIYMAEQNTMRRFWSHNIQTSKHNLL